MQGRPEQVVVVGAGHAGVELAASLRLSGFPGRIQILSDDAEHPYQRPPLSKDFLTSQSAIPLRAARFFDEKDISVRLGTGVVEIDRRTQRARLSTGEDLAYDHLVLATGARSRSLPVEGAETADILELRTLADARRLVTVLDRWRQVAIIGGGFVGLEAAALLRAARGIAVTVVEACPRLMQRAVSSVTSDWFARHHRGLGAEILLSTTVEAIEASHARTVLRLNDGRTLMADGIIAGIGIVPNTGLALAAGLQVEDGILVDEFLITTDPAISAIGDCASCRRHGSEKPVRLESVQNATDQARTLAKGLMGTPEPYAALPWFWSIQGKDGRLQIAGLAETGDASMVTGDLGAGRFSVSRHRGDRVVAVESINMPADHMSARRWLGPSVADP